MIGQELRQLQTALNRKADVVQRDFIAVSEKLQKLGRRILEAAAADRGPLVAEQDALRATQEALGGEINLWRDRARDLLRQPEGGALEAYLRRLLALGDESVRPAVERVLYILNAPEEELAQMAQGQAESRPATPAGRLIQRARVEFDLRGHDPAPRRQAAFEFANRAGMAQNDEALAELEAALANSDADPLVQEVVTLTVIQIHRFRATHLGDLDAAHASVQRLTRLKHAAVLPVLAEILAAPRTGFIHREDEMVEGNNLASRLAALACLIEWRTAESRAAVQARQRDREPQIAQMAVRALELFPGEWK
ncbi:MAG: hypothetical protein HY872_01945 [Chloroflexi bacterium]|nr:hypothetical protein [Chloroflexota bacterium]